MAGLIISKQSAYSLQVNVQKFVEDNVFQSQLQIWESIAKLGK
jgi:hypothetical protein